MICAFSNFSFFLAVKDLSVTGLCNLINNDVGSVPLLSDCHEFTTPHTAAYQIPIVVHCEVKVSIPSRKHCLHVFSVVIMLLYFVVIKVFFVAVIYN